MLAETTHEDLRGHAEHLFALVDRALAEAERARSDIRQIACDIGPGSFTGVRVAVASAKGIAAGLGVPLAGVVSLEAMVAHARSLHPSPALVAAAIDAKKGELYVALYDGAETLLAPTHLPQEQAAARIAEIAAGRPLVSIADSASFADFAVASAPAADDRAVLSAPPVHRLVASPSAVWVGRLVSSRPCGPAVHASQVVPLYVRAPDAVAANSVMTEPFAMLPAR